MRLTHRAIEARTHRTFRISQGGHDAFRMVVCELEHDGVVGYGEASPAKRVSGEDVASVGRFLDWAAKEVQDLRPDAWEAFLDHVHEDICGNPAARCALDLAVHDLVGKLQGVPARKLYDLPAARLETCMTVSLDEPRVMAEEAEGYAAKGFRVIKLKLGEASRDAERAVAVREALPEAGLRADANTGWSLDQARALLPRLARLDVEFCEQPFRPERDEDLAMLSKETPLTLYADESVMDAHDVRRLHKLGFRGGVNLKLMKTGGLRPAVRAIREAKELGYQVQLGCNVETALGISAGAQLLGLLNHADLDGHLLLKDEPFLGVRPERGWYETPSAPGLGARPA